MHVERGGNTGFVMMTCKSDLPGRLFFTQLLCQRVARGNIYLEDFKSLIPWPKASVRERNLSSKELLNLLKFRFRLSG